MIGTVDLPARADLRRIYRDIESEPVRIVPPPHRKPVTKPVESSPVARQALEKLLERQEFTVKLRSLPDFAES